MKAHLLTALGSLLFSALLMLAGSTAQAKGPADKITVSGLQGTDPIEITDPAALTEFSPWDDKFMDPSRGAAADPHAAKVYRISIEVKPQWLYSFDYAPDPSNGPGYIYLPGPGDPRYQRNTETIIRNQDGLWLYASADWARLMQSVLSSVSSSPKMLPATGVGQLRYITGTTMLGVLFLVVGASMLWMAGIYKR